MLEGKNLYLIVNLASLWGVTDQNYTELVQIHNDYKSKGLEILGFPSNDFKQEPGSARQIIELARKKYGAEFPIFEEAPVNGKDT